MIDILKNQVLKILKIEFVREMNLLTYMTHTGVEWNDRI